MKILTDIWLPKPNEIDDNLLRVEFNKNEYIDIEFKENFIRLRGCRQLLVLPEVSNALQIHLDDIE